MCTHSAVMFHNWMNLTSKTVKFGRKVGQHTHHVKVWHDHISKIIRHVFKRSCVILFYWCIWFHDLVCHCRFIFKIGPNFSTKGHPSTYHAVKRWPISMRRLYCGSIQTRYMSCIFGYQKKTVTRFGMTSTQSRLQRIQHKLTKYGPTCVVGQGMVKVFKSNMFQQIF